ncbi:MAG: zinc-finger family protein [Verrucomicrobiales bacterium]|nr:zinc-finger family protein [Verrucomicrobiales bacterium]
MKCQEMIELLHGLLDKELDPVRSLEAEQHLKECPACARRYEEEQVLRKIIAGGSLYYEAPRSLSRNVRSALRLASRAEAAPVSRSWSWDLGRLWLRARLLPIAVAALVLLLVLPSLVGPSTENRLAQEIVSAHSRSLMADHLTDVTSTDQHTVKPWFSGKVTFSPPVPNLSSQEFPLIGGRLDVLQEQPVAAMIYQHRKHFINLFIWPSTHGDSREKLSAQRGYNLIHWTQGGMNCWAVSDVNRADLQQFAQLVKAVLEKE